MNEDSGGPGPPSDTGIAGNTITDNISNSQPEKSINNYDLNNKYLSTDKGPYFVYMEHKSKNSGRLFPIKVGHFLQQNREFKNDILDIPTVYRFKTSQVLNTIDNFPELPPSSYASVTNSIRKPSFRNNYQTRLPPPKKRKTSNSQLTPGTSSGTTKNSKSQPVIPNPYRDKFIQHKESMNVGSAASSSSGFLDRTVHESLTIVAVVLLAIALADYLYKHYKEQTSENNKG
nr:unnamed protein product [Callosobruchus chinensis]